MSKKIIIYDFDGTLADTFTATIEIYNRIAAEKGFKTITSDNVEMIRSSSPGEIMKILGVKLYQLPPLVIRARKELKSAMPTVQLHAGIKEMVYGLKELGYEQGIVTSNSKENVNEFLKKNDLEIFDFFYGGGSLFGKAAILKKIIKERHVLPQDIIYVGDEVRDIEAAKQAGTKMIAVSWGFNKRSALEKRAPEVLIDRPGELVMAIKEMKI